MISLNSMRGLKPLCLYVHLSDVSLCCISDVPSSTISNAFYRLCPLSHLSLSSVQHSLRVVVVCFSTGYHLFYSILILVAVRLCETGSWSDATCTQTDVHCGCGRCYHYGLALFEVMHIDHGLYMWLSGGSHFPTDFMAASF